MRISDWSSDVCSSDLPFELRDHAGDELVRSTMCAPNAAVTLNLVKERVNRARGHRIAADEQRMKPQRLAKLLMIYEAGNDGINRTPPLKTGQPGALEHQLSENENGRWSQIPKSPFAKPHTN